MHLAVARNNKSFVSIDLKIQIADLLHIVTYHCQFGFESWHENRARACSLCLEAMKELWKKMEEVD